MDSPNEIRWRQCPSAARVDEIKMTSKAEHANRERTYTSNLIGLATFNRILSSLPRYGCNAKKSYQPATLIPYCVYIESMRSTRYLVLITATHPSTFGYRGGNNAIVISKVSGVIHPVIRIRSTWRYVRNKWFYNGTSKSIKFSIIVERWPWCRENVGEVSTTCFAHYDVKARKYILQ